MTVYVLFSGNIEPSIEGIYESLESAQAAVPRVADWNDSGIASSDRGIPEWWSNVGIGYSIEAWLVSA